MSEPEKTTKVIQTCGEPIEVALTRVQRTGIDGRETWKLSLQRQARSVWDMTESLPRALRSFLVY